MKRLLTIAAALVAVLLLAAAVFVVPTIWGKPWSYDHFTMRVLVLEFENQPQLRARLGVTLPFTASSTPRSGRGCAS